MRKYTTDHISKLMHQYCEETDLFQLMQTLQELSQLWSSLPDPALRKLQLEATLTTDGVLSFQCPSSVILSYCRRQQQLIEQHLGPFMEQHQITRITFQL